MPLETLLKLLSAAKFPLAIGFFGIALNLGSANKVMQGLGSTAGLLGCGSALTVVTRKDDQLGEIRKLTERYNREKAFLQESINTALADVATAQSEAQHHAVIAQRSEGAIAQLQSTIAALRAEQERLKDEALNMSNMANKAAASAATCHGDNSLLAGQLATLEAERVQLIAELYETAVEEVVLHGAIAGLESQFANDSAYQVGQKKKAKSELTKARANFHTEISEAQERIEELEGQLAEKTQQAKQLLADVHGDAEGRLTQIGGQLGGQAEIIKALQVQLDEARKTNKALTYRRFDTVGTDNVLGNRLIDALAKQGSTYGAFHHEREGHNGRLKVWLSIIDAPLKRAQDCLDDLEAGLNLWAKPAVKVDRGMHLFTLATEQEHKVLAAPNVPLTRLERTLDSAIHGRIVGGSGSGKTVLLNNLMHYMAASMKGANVTLLDPKAVDDWGNFTPRYWGEECVTGIVDLADSLKGRVSNTVKARKAGKPSPNYSPELFIVDEAQ